MTLLQNAEQGLSQEPGRRTLSGSATLDTEPAMLRNFLLSLGLLALAACAQTGTDTARITPQEADAGQVTTDDVGDALTTNSVWSGGIYGPITR